MGLFEQTAPSLESYWRAIILFGRNVASYKFALAQSLIELSVDGKSFVPMADLADPFARHISDHLEHFPKQTTSRSSKFLEVCLAFNQGKATKDEMNGATARLGFNNVINAFHVVNSGEVPNRFFLDRRQDSTPGIELTDDFFRLRESAQFESLPCEVEARWRLVETAWELHLPARMLIHFNPAKIGRAHV